MARRRMTCEIHLTSKLEKVLHDKIIFSKNLKCEQELCTRMGWGDLSKGPEAGRY